MHFEILVEDRSGKAMLDLLVPKIIGKDDSFSVIAYKGVGRIPSGLKSPKDASRRILLENLPKLLGGYGRQNWPPGYGAVFVICDLDDKCLKSFRNELLALLDRCNNKPEVTRFCIAIEEGEAWLLGDIKAIKTAYPNAKSAVLEAYKPDSICDTWEQLANAVYKGGARKLSERGWQVEGAEKANWARSITPHMDLTGNQSPSFNYFRNKLIELAANVE
ncbi:MAG: DUF4276 family protein [Methylomonas sp.]|nr:DUF4276 family protein [Methylomonas sp.]